MKKNTLRSVGMALVMLVWLALVIASWVKPSTELSLTERRKLAQFPKLTVQTVLDGGFMSKFESYAQDQFPLRESFRQLKAVYQVYGLGQGQNNDIVLSQGYAAKLEYPLNETSVQNALGKFNGIYEQYLKGTGSTVVSALIPDKNCYLSPVDTLKLDYDRLNELMAAGMPYATTVDLRDTLALTDYYRLDTHWRQEKLFPAAQKLAQTLGIPAPQAEDYTVTPVKEDFYGVYYGQLALSLAPEPLNILKNEMLEHCQVYNHETDQITQVYDLEKLDGNDPYDVFLSGATALLTIENPDAETERELIVFRDSFGSSMIPLLVQGYRTVTVVDIRYLSSQALGQYVDFHGQDVLFLYSTLVLNQSAILK